MSSPWIGFSLAIISIIFMCVNAWINGVGQGYRKGNAEGIKEGYAKGLTEGQKLAEKRYG